MNVHLGLILRLTSIPQCNTMITVTITCIYKMSIYTSYFISGMIHAGIGPTHVNAFLTTMDIPAVSSTMLQGRSSEAGPAIEVVAKASCTAARIAERTAELEKSSTPDEGQDVHIPVSYDMGWQKPRGFNSLTGTGHVMGPNTGYVLDYETRNKRCAQCDSAKRRKEIAKTHDCRKNFSGSSKAMEGSVAVSLFKKALDTNTKYKTLIGDDDSTTIAWLRAEVDSEVEKQSDINHSKRALHGQLAAIKSKHKELTQRVIDYIKKCYIYAITQNANNPVMLSAALNAIPEHMAGNHVCCCISWCGYLQRLGPNMPGVKPYQHSNIKHDITSVELKADLVRIMGNFATNADKLAPQGSSQRNESLNCTIVSKTTKSRHYGGSPQNDYRVSAGIAQKNLSYSYIPKVMQTLDVSPGKFTKIHAIRKNTERARLRARSRTPAFKRRRLARKSERASHSTATEICEGVAYEAGVGFNNEEIDTTQIPEHDFCPKWVQLQSANQENIILFDIETASSGTIVELTQLAAVKLCDESSSFSQYILPTCPIAKKIEELTGLSVQRRGGKRVLCRKLPGAHSQSPAEVASLPINEALQRFLDWMEEIQHNNPDNSKFILVGHNAQSFDVRHLMHHIVACSMLECFKNVVLGMGDTLPYFRNVYSSSLTSFKQSSMYSALFGEDYNAHDAKADVDALRRLLGHTLATYPDAEFHLHCFTAASAQAVLEWCAKKNTRLSTLTHLFSGKDKVITKTMAQKISGSGLAYQHLKCVYQRSGEEGFIALLTAKTHNMVRVTNRKDILKSLCDHFASLQ